MKKFENIFMVLISKKENRAIFAAIMVLIILLLTVIYIYPRAAFTKKIKEFLTQRYNEPFEINYIEKQNIILGINEDMVNGYIYEFYSLNMPEVKSYILCMKLKNSNTSVYEVPEAEAIIDADKNFCYYSNYKKNYEEKLTIKEQLESLYSDAIKFDWLSENNAIFIEVETNMEDSIYENFDEFSTRYNSTIDVLSGTNVTVKIRYSDCLREINGNKEKLTKENVNGLLW